MSALEELLRSGPATGDAAHLVRRFAERAVEAGAVDIAYGHADSPFGSLVVAATDRGLVRLAYPDRDLGAVLGELAERVSPRILEAPSRIDEIRRQIDEYFTGRRSDFDLPIDWRACRPGFSRRVLEETARIPPGSVLTYGEIAARAGSPGASRAAGNALGANRIPIVVPCHRIVAAGGKLGGYTGGLERKRHLLEIEGWAASEGGRLF